MTLNKYWKNSQNAPYEKSPGVIHFTTGLCYIRLMYYVNVSNGFDWGVRVEPPPLIYCTYTSYFLGKKLEISKLIKTVEPRKYL